MTIDEAVRRAMIAAADADWNGDCADLCLRYLEFLRGAPQPRPDASALSVREVSAVLGPPRRGPPRFGDVVLFQGGLGVWLGYAVLAVDEASRRPARVPPRGTVLAWSVGRG